MRTGRSVTVSGGTGGASQKKFWGKKLEKKFELKKIWINPPQKLETPEKLETPLPWKFGDPPKIGDPQKIGDPPKIWRPTGQTTPPQGPDHQLPLWTDRCLWTYYLGPTSLRPVKIQETK